MARGSRGAYVIWETAVDISFDCIGCGTHILIDEAGEGLSVQCPVCSRNVIVPSFSNGGPGSPPRAKSQEETTSLGLATEKQRAYLRDLGVAFGGAHLTKEQASGLIEDALSNRPPTQRQIGKLRRLGRLAELEEDDTALDASAVLEGILLGSPTENQLARLKELGLTITGDWEFSAGELDEILKLTDRQPDAEMLKALQALGIEWSCGTALHARMVLDLAFAYGTGPWKYELPTSELANVCIAATKDPAFYNAMIDNGSLGIQYFSWPEAKMQGWVQNNIDPIAAYQRETELKPGDAFAWFQLGNAYSGSKRFDDAVVAYRQAISVGRDYALAWLGLAAAYHKSGRATEAEAAFAESRRLDPKSFMQFIEAGKGSALLAEAQKLYPKLFK
jgi:tetratricopeptide (TPR) repeat protein